MKQKEIIKLLNKASDCMQDDLEQAKAKNNTSYFKTTLELLDITKMLVRRLESTLGGEDSESKI